MANLIIEVPDELVPGLEGIAASRRMSIQQLALDHLRSLLPEIVEPRAGSPLALLRAVGEPPQLSLTDVDEMDAAISAGRRPVQSVDLF